VTAWPGCVAGRRSGALWVGNLVDVVYAARLFPGVIYALFNRREFSGRDVIAARGSG